MMIIGYMSLVVGGAIWAGVTLYDNADRIFDKVTDALALACYGIGRVIDMIPDNACM
jgi:hypothetical protein